MERNEQSAEARRSGARHVPAGIAPSGDLDDGEQLQVGIGIPYATADVSSRGIYCLMCPLCGLALWATEASIAALDPRDRSTPEDAATKGAARAYAEHYRRIHAPDRPQRCLSCACKMAQRCKPSCGGYRPMPGGPEQVAQEGDWLVCICGNEPSQSGFYPCQPDGAIVTPDVDGPWDGVHYACAECGRIVDQVTLIVTGKRDPAGIAEEADAAEGR